MYEEIVYICLTALIGTLSGVLATTFTLKRYGSDENIMNKLEMILTNITTDEGLQKQIYAAGVLLGSGIAKGTGIQGGGKFKFSDIIGQGLAGWFSNMMGRTKQQTENPNMNPAPGTGTELARSKKW